MLDFLTNNKVYELQSDNQIASILSQFDSDYIMDVVENTLQSMFNQFDTFAKPNVPKAYEDVFKSLYNAYPTDQDNINDTRYETYKSIITIICNRYGLEFYEDEYLDMYTMAYILYDFFVSRFNNYMIEFFSRYIYEQRDDIYRNLNLEELSKERDTSSNYGRMVFGDQECMAVIAANLPLVLGSLRSLDTISDELIYRYAYGTTETGLNMTMMLLNHITVPGGIYALYNRLLFTEELYPSIVTNIRLKIQMQYQFAIDAAKAANMK